MSENSAIEWTDHTFNPWEGCQKVSPGCDHCYAETRNARFGGGTAINWGPGAPRRRTSQANWRKPLAWNKAHAEFFAANGRRQRVFCASLADVFDNAVDPHWRADLFRLIEATPNLDWLLLTKRIGNWSEQVLEALKWAAANSSPDLAYWIGQWFDGRPPANVWIGATVVNQDEADRDIPKLLAVPAARRFLSMEPLLGPVDLTEWLWNFKSCTNCPCPNPNISRISIEKCCCDPELVDSLLDWVIAGGESGAGARPMHPEWPRSLRDQCAAAGVPFLFKQWGEWAPNWLNDEAGLMIPGSEWMDRMGKKLAGRLLDGVQHDGYPAAP